MNSTDLKTGDIILIKSKLLIGRLIRFVTKYDYNHVEVIVENWGIPYTIGAIAKGISTRLAKDYYASKDIIKVKILRPKVAIDEKQFATRVLSKTGTVKYDYASLFWWGLRNQISGRWRGKTDQTGAEKRFYCSEFVGWAYQNFFSEWWKTTPEDLGTNSNFDTIFEGIIKRS